MTACSIAARVDRIRTMGRRGPAKTPVAELKKRGTYRKDRHSDAVDSELVPCLPAPPVHFDEDQKAVWNDIGQRLADKGLMTELDAQAFELRALDVDVFARIRLASLADGRGVGIGIARLAHFLRDLEFDGQTVAIPTRDVRRTVSAQ